jgi:hypothetical protein
MLVMLLVPQADSKPVAVPNEATGIKGKPAMVWMIFLRERLLVCDMECSGLKSMKRLKRMMKRTLFSGVAYS